MKKKSLIRLSLFNISKTCAKLNYWIESTSTIYGKVKSMCNVSGTCKNLRVHIVIFWSGSSIYFRQLMEEIHLV